MEQNVFNFKLTKNVCMMYIKQLKSTVLINLFEYYKIRQHFLWVQLQQYY